MNCSGNSRSAELWNIRPLFLIRFNERSNNALMTAWLQYPVSAFVGHCRYTALRSADEQKAASYGVNLLSVRPECCGQRTVRFQDNKANSSHSHSFGNNNQAPEVAFHSPSPNAKNLTFGST